MTTTKKTPIATPTTETLRTDVPRVIGLPCVRARRQRRSSSPTTCVSAATSSAPVTPHTSRPTCARQLRRSEITGRTTALTGALSVARASLREGALDDEIEKRTLV